MVDAVVSFLVERLEDFRIREATFLQGFGDQVTWLRDALRYTQRFLKDAEERQYGDVTICGWVFDVRELAYDIEDLLNTFHHAEEKQYGETDGGDDDDDDGGMMELKKAKLGCYPSVFSCIFDKGKDHVNLYNIGKKIKEFKKRLNELSRRRQLYGLQDSGNRMGGSSNSLERLRELRRFDSFAVEDSNLVGLEDDFKSLLAKLLDNEPHLSVISIYGMDGLGKTSLARKLYLHSDVKMKFGNCCAWVSVSQDFSIENLLIRIIRSFAIGDKKLKDLEMMNADNLGLYLRRSLYRCSYLLVIDDVMYREEWEKLKRFFPDNQNGGRIIITTPSKAVAESSDDRTYAHDLRFLTTDESWQIFWNKSFQIFNTNEGLKKLGRGMVKKCNDLPLAIIVLRGLLAGKKPQEWREVRDHLWKHLKADSIEIHSLLALSFDCLPYQLKQCFLYIGFLPKDYEIKHGEINLSLGGGRFRTT